MATGDPPTPIDIIADHEARKSPLVVQQPPLLVPDLTLRDWFAGQALMGTCAGLCASVSTPSDDFPRSAFNLIDFSDTAKHAYQLADAMLAARKEASDE